MCRLHICLKHLSFSFISDSRQAPEKHLPPLLPRRPKISRNKNVQSADVEGAGATATGLNDLPEHNAVYSPRLPPREHQSSFNSMEAFAGSRENMSFAGLSSTSGSGQTDTESTTSDSRTSERLPTCEEVPNRYVYFCYILLLRWKDMTQILQFIYIIFPILFSSTPNTPLSSSASMNTVLSQTNAPSCSSQPNISDSVPPATTASAQLARISSISSAVSDPSNSLSDSPLVDVSSQVVSSIPHGLRPNSDGTHSTSYGAQLVISTHPTRQESSRPVNNVTLSHAITVPTPVRTSTHVEGASHVSRGSPVRDSGVSEPAARNATPSTKDSPARTSPEQREINRQQIHQHLYNWRHQNTMESPPNSQVRGP